MIAADLTAVTALMLAAGSALSLVVVAYRLIESL